MSVKTNVFIRDDQLPSLVEWQRALNALGIDIVLENVGDLRGHAGFLPAKFNGIDSGFEWYYGSPEGMSDEMPTTIGDRNQAITMVTRSSLIDLECALLSAAAIAKVTDGLFYDEENDVFVPGDRALEIAKGIHKVDFDRGRRQAEKDADLTDRRCPECGAPCPTYRKTCKACGYAIGRAE